MRKIRYKEPRLRLDLDSYRELHRQMLERDGWRCQVCGSMQGLKVHHLTFRSHSGDDAEDNLITLCTASHKRIHQSCPTLDYAAIRMALLPWLRRL